MCVCLVLFLAIRKLRLRHQRAHQQAGQPRVHQQHRRRRQGHPEARQHH